MLGQAGDGVQSSTRAAFALLTLATHGCAPARSCTVVYPWLWLAFVSPGQVRAFKSEIDALTTRSRFAEGAFLNLYKLLREAPDPAVAVQALAEAAKDAVAALEERNRWGDAMRCDAARCHRAFAVEARG